MSRELSQKAFGPIFFSKLLKTCLILEHLECLRKSFWHFYQDTID